jgi:hypothetical protein
MKKFPTTSMNSIRSLLAFLLVTAVLHLPATVAFASPPGSPVTLATLRVAGDVKVNDVLAFSGQTILSGSHVVTASKSQSIFELGNFTRLSLSEQTDLALDFSAANISGSLRQGEVRAFIPADRTLSIVTPDGVVATDSCEAVVFRVLVAADGTRVSVDSGHVALQAGNERRVLAAGETLSTARSGLPKPVAGQGFSKNERLGIVAGIGGGVALLLVALLVGNPEPELNFGGCAIVPSPGAPTTCP